MCLSWPALGLTAMCSLGWGNLVAFDWNDLPVGREFDCKFLKKSQIPSPDLRMIRPSCLCLSKCRSIYRKLSIKSPSMYKPPKLATQKNPPLNRPSEYKPPGTCTWKLPSNSTHFKTKQKRYSNTFFYLPKNYGQLLLVPNGCSQKVSQFIAVCVVHSSLLAWISSVHIDKVLAWLSFRKIYVLMTSFSKNFVQITDINFLPTIS